MRAASGQASGWPRYAIAVVGTEPGSRCPALEFDGRPRCSANAVRAAVTDAGQETQRLTRLTDDLLLLAHADNNHPTRLRQTVGNLLDNAILHSPRAHPSS